MKIKKLYLDMDGVLANFEKRFAELYGEHALGTRDEKHFYTNWPNFVKTRQFETLEKWPGHDELISFVESARETYQLEVKILSSSGGQKFYDEITEQKTIWLKNHQITYLPIIVPGRKLKKQYASPDSILIDDTDDVIDDFNREGGIGILHRDVKDTIRIVKKHLENSLNT